jgi:hypothetical protein
MKGRRRMKGNEGEKEKENTSGGFIHENDVRVGKESNGGTKFAFCSSAVALCVLVRVFLEAKLCKEK